MFIVTKKKNILEFRHTIHTLLKVDMKNDNFSYVQYHQCIFHSINNSTALFPMLYLGIRFGKQKEKKETWKFNQ